MPKKKEAIIIGLILLVLSVFVYFQDPSKGPILPCVFNKITGLYCPGCGMTRAVNAVFKLNFYQAFRFNALIFIMPIMLGFYYGASYLKKPQLAKITLILMLVVALGYGVLRNLESFSALSPQLSSRGFLH